MISAPVPANEPERLSALESLDVLDSPRNSALDNITRAVADFCEAPIALVSLVDSDRQWFKASVGLTARETSRDIAFCAHAILEPAELMIVPDTHLDPRFCDNPLVTAEPFVRFYAGQPLSTNDGLAIGTLCLLDGKPRQLTTAQQNGLAKMSWVVTELIELGFACEQPKPSGQWFTARENAGKRNILRHGQLVMECDAGRVTCGAANIDLTPKEFALLKLLMENRLQLLKPEEILEQVWGYDDDPLTNVVAVYVRRLRTKIKRQDGLPFITNQRGFGYRFG